MYSHWWFYSAKIIHNYKVLLFTWNSCIGWGANTTYTESLNIKDAREGWSYEEKNGATKPTALHLKRLK